MTEMNRREAIKAGASVGVVAAVGTGARLFAATLDTSPATIAKYLQWREPRPVALFAVDDLPNRMGALTLVTLVILYKMPGVETPERAEYAGTILVDPADQRYAYASKQETLIASMSCCVEADVESGRLRVVTYDNPEDPSTRRKVWREVEWMRYREATD